MENDSSPLHPDPEIAALLAFEPVPRKCVRRDGWTADSQRAYVAGLAETGDANLSANALGRTARGAYELRRAAGGEAFAAAWDEALALHARRSGQPAPKAAARPPAAAEAGKSEPDEVEWDAFVEAILHKYLLKLDAERRARLAGDIIEADYCVRQLTWLEVALDLGGKGPELLKRLRRGNCDAGEIAATPMSLLLDRARRALWAERGEPERPPLPPLGEHDGEISTGPRWWYSSDRDRDIGPDEYWRRQKAAEALAAEAQRAWEEKARKDSAAWRARLEGEPQADREAQAGGAGEDEAQAGPQIRSL